MDGDWGWELEESMTVIWPIFFKAIVKKLLMLTFYFSFWTAK